MFKKKFAHLKPGVSKYTQLLLAALLWTVIGCGLITRGVIWLDHTGQWWIIAVGLLFGSCKSLLVLDKSAKKGIQRILNFSDGTCVGAVYSIKTWLLVCCMMAVGYFLRHSALPLPLLALLYITVGWGLVMSSRHAWVVWNKND